MSVIASTYPSSSSSSSLSGLFAGRTPGSTLDSQSIEQIMEEVYAVAYGPESQASRLEAVPGDCTFQSSLQEAHPWSFGQQMDSPKVIFMVYAAHGQEVLQPMVPIRKCDYFDMETFERAQQQRPVCDVFSEILWSKSYDVEMSFEASSEPRMTQEEVKDLDKYFDTQAFVQAQRQNFSEQPTDMTEQLAFSRITNQLVKSGEVLQFDTPKRRATFPGEIRWQEVLKNYSDLPSAMFPDNLPGVVQGSENSRFCFIDSRGGRHYTNIVLSDEYMLVPLPSDTIADRPLWDSPAQPDSRPCFVSLCDVSPPLDLGLRLPEGVGMEVDSSPSSFKLSSAKKRGQSRARNTAKKLCTARKHVAVAHSHTRLIGPTTRGNPQSERAPMLLTSFDLDFTTYDSSAVSSSSSPSPSNIVLNLKCWIDNCPRSFMKLGNLEAHHNMCHQGQTAFVCPFRDSCLHRTMKQGEMKRHIKSVQHLGGDSLLCPNRCSGKTFSRVDALRRHLKGCPNK
ncbi:hypothetical protein HHX47_DHR7000174 [Lentinula edodes]|nr:hypothetical protein HHX47_DHR7000174 [Lentinula edodes]